MKLIWGKNILWVVLIVGLISTPLIQYYFFPETAEIDSYSITKVMVKNQPNPQSTETENSMEIPFLKIEYSFYASGQLITDEITIPQNSKLLEHKFQITEKGLMVRLDGNLDNHEIVFSNWFPKINRIKKTK
jgi:hypothetical protein